MAGTSAVAAMPRARPVRVLRLTKRREIAPCVTTSAHHPLRVIRRDATCTTGAPRRGSTAGSSGGGVEVGWKSRITAFSGTLRPGDEPATPARRAEKACPGPSGSGIRPRDRDGPGPSRKCRLREDSPVQGGRAHGHIACPEYPSRCSAATAGAPHRPQQVRSDRRPRQERHRHSAGRRCGSLRLHDLDSPRLRELRRAAGEPRADEQELRERGEALCEQIDLRQAGIRDLLSY